MTLVKLRNARYCNLKLFLIFLVVYGHLIEPNIYSSDCVMFQYRMIYFIHMPLFSFVSGLFIKSEKNCRSQLSKTFPLYIVLQTLHVIFGKGTVKFFTPWWHLWYLLSYCTWLCMTWIWYRLCNSKGKLIILLCSLAVGCLAGHL